MTWTDYKKYILLKMAQYFERGRGKILKGGRYILVTTAGSYDYGSNSAYLNTSNTDEISHLCQGNIAGTDQAFLTSSPDNMYGSSIEDLGGVIYFKKSGDYLKSCPQNDKNLGLKIKLVHDHLDELYVGTPYKLESSNQGLLVQKRDTSDTDDQEIYKKIRSDKNYTLNPVKFKATTLTASISQNDDHLDFSSFTFSKSPSVYVRPEGHVLLTDGTLEEWARFSYFDPIDNRLWLSARGMFGTTAREWSGSVEIHIYNGSLLENYDQLNGISGMKTGLNWYILPEPSETYLRPQTTLKYLYDYPNYFRATSVYHADTGKQVTEYSSHPLTWHLYYTRKIPGNLSDDMSSYNNKIVIKGTGNTYSDRWFVNVHDADQGYFYDYCERNETCGSCMGNVANTGNVCFVKADGFVAAQKGDDALDEKENKNWNRRNEEENFYVPIIAVSFVFITTLMMAIFYTAYFVRFQTSLNSDPNIDKKMNGWGAENERIHHWGIGWGIPTGFIYLGLVAIIIIAVTQKPGDPKARIFPIVNYNRSVYNAPPGYTFVDAPGSKDDPVS